MTWATRPDVGCYYLNRLLAAPEHRPHWVRVARLLGEHGLRQDTAASREEFERQMEVRRLEETDPEALMVLRRGWCFGSQEFKNQMLEKIAGQLGEHDSGGLRCAYWRRNRSTLGECSAALIMLRWAAVFARFPAAL